MHGGHASGGFTGDAGVGVDVAGGGVAVDPPVVVRDGVAFDPVIIAACCHVNARAIAAKAVESGAATGDQAIIADLEPIATV